MHPTFARLVVVAAILAAPGLAACVDGGGAPADAGADRDGGDDVVDASTPDVDAGAPGDAGAPIVDGGADDAGAPTSSEAPCTFNADCPVVEHCACDEAIGCRCLVGARGTGVNGIDTCSSSDDCETALCVEGPGGTFYCSGPCSTAADCTGALPICADIAFIGQICIRTPGT